MFTLGGAKFTGGAACTVGGAHKRGRGTPKLYWGGFFGGHSYFQSMSNDFSEKQRDLKSVSQCPFKLSGNLS